MEEKFPDIVATQPALLAHHYSESLIKHEPMRRTHWVFGTRYIVASRRRSSQTHTSLV
jgi:hypothetical protein